MSQDLKRLASLYFIRASSLISKKLKKVESWRVLAVSVNLSSGHQNNNLLIEWFKSETLISSSCTAIRRSKYIISLVWLLPIIVSIFCKFSNWLYSVLLVGQK